MNNIKFTKVANLISNNFEETLFHGTSENIIGEFKTNKGLRGNGIFFCDSYKYAKKFGCNIYVCQILLTKPKIYVNSLDLEIDSQKNNSSENLCEILKKDGYDGIVILNSKVSTGIVKEVICFYPNAIKTMHKL
jgi:hypothetical protein